MEITTKKSVQLKTEVIDAISNEPTAIEDFEKIAAKWAKELVKETFDSAEKCRKFFTEDALEFSVSISLGEPEDEEAN